ncbi:MAG: hydroxyacylglutathione hydrolase [Betaproteobacteria bacterium]|nr:hydroxyacylglutathione hydrolase [Betaproteobacteria bacterium]
MLKIVPIEAFKDNYIWVIQEESRAAVVDPGDARPVVDYLVREQLSLAAILVTHHHPDHVGGVLDLLESHPAPVYGPRNEPIPGITHAVAEGDQVTLDGPAVSLSVLEIPGHTRGHVAYYGADFLFCGDTLFAGGCGRVFEGTPAQMHASLSKLAALPGHMRVYCAHEYTLANLRFARAVEPDNSALAERETADRLSREAGRPTVPSTIAKEKATNPFLRCHEASVAASAMRRLGQPIADPVAVFAAIREWKNGF